MFSRIASALDRSLELISKGALLFSGLLLMAMGFNVTYGVIKRYVFADPSIVAIELVKILMIPALVLAVSYVQRNGRHLKVDFLSLRFPEKVQYIIAEIAVPLMGLFVKFNGSAGYAQGFGVFIGLSVLSIVLIAVLNRQSPESVKDAIRNTSKSI